MSEQSEKRLKLLFRIYAVFIAIVGFGLIWGFVPSDIGQDVLKLPLGNIFHAGSAEFLDLMKSFTTGYIIFAFIIAGLGAIVSIGTRDVFEVLALFFTGMLPRERKYWGVVFDQQTNASLAFVPVRVFKYSEGKGTLLTQTVTDTDGRYRLHINDKGGEKYTIEVHYPGYNPVVSDVDQFLVIGNYELVSDIALQKENTKMSRLKSWFYYMRPRFFTVLFYGIYYSYLFILLSVIVLLINDPIFINLFVVIMFTMTALWNTNIVRLRLKPPIGKVVELQKQEPVSKAFVNIYSPTGEIAAITDQAGVVKLNIPSGIYRSLVSAAGYKMMGRDTQGFKIVKVGKDGYIDKNILMEKSATPVASPPQPPIAAAVPAPAAPVVSVAQPAIPAPTPVPAATPQPQTTDDNASLMNPFS